MTVAVAEPISAMPAARPGSAVLTFGCDGYPAGSTGVVTGWKEGCVIFVPDHPGRAARWARPRSTLLVPVGLLAIYR